MYWALVIAACSTPCPLLPSCKGNVGWGHWGRNAGISRQCPSRALMLGVQDSRPPEPAPPTAPCSPKALPGVREPQESLQRALRTHSFLRRRRTTLGAAQRTAGEMPAVSWAPRGGAMR